MRTLLASLVFMTGCGCGGFSGGSDRVYASNSDALTICENGGFVATIAGATTEGRYDEATLVGTRGDTGAVAFTMTTNADGTVSTKPLSDNDWTLLSLNPTELDHADVQCTDLTTRAWWSQQP